MTAAPPGEVVPVPSGPPPAILDMEGRGVRVHAGLWRERCEFARIALATSTHPEDADRLLQLNVYAPEILRRARQGRVTARWTQQGPGRWGCYKPHLQQIAKDHGLRDAVIPADGARFIVGDWRTAHLWIAAGLAADTALLADLESGDLYEHAAKIWAPELEDGRKAGKIACLTTLNGAGATLLAQKLAEHGVTVSPADAKKRQREWLARYPDLHRYLVTVPSTRTWTTPSGRVVEVPSNKPKHAIAAWRWQSHEVDILVRAMQLVSQWPVVFTVHDEMLLEVPEASASAAAADLTAAMDVALRETLQLQPGDPARTVKVEIRPSWSGDVPDVWPDDVGDDHGHETTPDGRPYVVRKGEDTGFFVATATGYVYTRADLMRVLLERHWPTLPTWNVDEDGHPKSPKDASQLWTEFGAYAKELFYTYTGTTRYVYGSEHSGELHVRVCHPVGVAPVCHADCLEWLRLAFNDLTLDWLSLATLLELPTCALVLLGEGGIGKTMIAHALARYFGVSVADYDDVFKGRFNDALLRSPVVLLDESTEVDSRSSGFRKLVANSAHAVEGKNKPTGTLRGCARFVISSNEPDPLRLGREQLSQASEDSIGERILMVDCNPAATAWLRERGGRAFTHDWIDRGDAPGRLVETIAWLVVHRGPSVVRGTRFLVQGNAAEWAARIGTREGLPADILNTIAHYYAMGKTRRIELFGPRGAKTDRRPFRFDADKYPDKILVLTNKLLDAWTVLARERPPSHRKLGEALAKLGGRKPGQGGESLHPASGRCKGYRVPLSMLAGRLIEPDEDDWTNEPKPLGDPDD